MIADLPLCLQQGLAFALGPSYGTIRLVSKSHLSIYEPCGLGQTISLLLS